MTETSRRESSENEATDKHGFVYGSRIQSVKSVAKNAKGIRLGREWTNGEQESI